MDAERQGRRKPSYPQDTKATEDSLRAAFSAAQRHRAHRERGSFQANIHQYLRSIGSHFVTVTGFQSSFGLPSAQVTSVCRM